ncbi:MAG TPA: ABC transporter permease [Vicinamibacteria bacterium]|nr:ABC transporter permease [Vicinamibacteria bacterium]
MSTRSEAVPESAAAAPAAGAAPSPTRPFFWSVRREVWENRSLYVGPLVVASVVLLSFALSAMVNLPRRLRGLSALDPGQQRVTLASPYSVGATMIMFAAVVVAVFYCLDALHGERRDRSILFWKSLPVSDRTTVLSKLAVPLVVLPLFSLAISLATQLLMFGFANLVALASGAGAGALWTRLPLLPMWVAMVYGLVVHALWHAPLYAWLLLVSAWARRAPLVWAVLPLLVIGAFEAMAFNTSHFARWVGYRVGGAMQVAFNLKPKGHEIIHSFGQLDPLGFLGSSGLWNGLLAAALLVALTIRLRRRAEPL